MKNIEEKSYWQMKKSSSYKTKEKSSSVSRKRKNEKREIDGFMKKEEELKEKTERLKELIFFLIWIRKIQALLIVNRKKIWLKKQRALNMKDKRRLI